MSGNRLQELSKSKKVPNFSINNRIKRSLKILFGIERAYRGDFVRPQDTFLVSYPKSGNTWARFLLGNLLEPDSPVSFKNIEKIIPRYLSK